VFIEEYICGFIFVFSLLLLLVLLVLLILLREILLFYKNNRIYYGSYNILPIPIIIYLAYLFIPPI
jgi:hypothetical protein